MPKKPAAIGEAQIEALMQEVKDPELPFLDIVELGIYRGAYWRGQTLVVQLTPTYTGCPALKVLEEQVRERLAEAGVESIKVEWVYAPAWSTDWIHESARQKMKAHGIAPPLPAACTPGSNVKLLFAEDHPPVPCPYCQSQNTRLRSEFGPTACKALWVCQDCKQPFEYFKCL